MQQALKNKWTAAVAAGIMLLAAGCEEKQTTSSSVSGSQPAGEKQETHAALQSDTGVKAPIAEAENVPEAEKSAILQVLSRQITAFNEQDVQAYMSTISESSESFSHAEEKAYVEKVFRTFDASMKPGQVTIIQYDEENKTANVFMNMHSTSKDRSSGKEVRQTTRQIAVFQKEQNEWKQVSLFAME